MFSLCVPASTYQHSKGVLATVIDKLPDLCTQLAQLNIYSSSTKCPNRDQPASLLHAPFQELRVLPSCRGAGFSPWHPGERGTKHGASSVGVCRPGQEGRLSHRELGHAQTEGWEMQPRCAPRAAERRKPASATPALARCQPWHGGHVLVVSGDQVLSRIWAERVCDSGRPSWVGLRAPEVNTWPSQDPGSLMSWHTHANTHKSTSSVALRTLPWLWNKSPERFYFVKLTLCTH